MKRFIYQSTLVCMLCLLCAACKKDFLNIVPKGQQVASTTNDYALLMNNPSFYLYSVGGWQSPGLMGDDVAAENTYFSAAKLPTQQSFKWADDIYQNGDLVFELSVRLSNLYTINLVINGVMQSTGGTDQQKKAIQGEALATRAWLYFQFVNYYGKPYAAATAAADPAFPVIKEANINTTNYTRNSVQEIYDFMISDLTTAIAALPVTNTGGKTRYSKPAAEALLGKIYLFMGKPSNALPFLNAAITDNAASATPAKLYDYNQEFATGGKFSPITIDGPSNSPELNYNDNTESLIALSFYNGVYDGNGFGADFVVLSPSAAALFAPSDLRLNFYTPHFAYNQVNPSGRLSKYLSYSGPYVKYGIQYPELLLLRAECEARLNDLTGAKTDLETLRKCRMPVANAPVPSANSGTQLALLQFVFDEREREFATQGYRWFDMRRLSVDPLFPARTYTHILYNDATSSNTTIYTLNPIRFTQRLPPYIMTANPQIQNNP